MLHPAESVGDSIPKVSSSLEGDLVQSLEVDGIRMCDVCFFLPCEQSCLLASPMVHAVTEAHGHYKDRLWSNSYGTDLDLDFLIFDSTADPSNISRSSRQVHYGFLQSSQPPARKAGETIAQRATALREWIQNCYKDAYGCGGSIGSSSPKNSGLARSARQGNNPNSNANSHNHNSNVAPLVLKGSDVSTVLLSGPGEDGGSNLHLNRLASSFNVVNGMGSPPPVDLFQQQPSPPPQPPASPCAKLEGWLQLTAPLFTRQYDAYVKLTSAQQNQARRHIQLAESGKTSGPAKSRQITFTIPLFLSYGTRVTDTLSALASTYAKLTNAPWSASLHSITTCDFDVNLTLEVSNHDGKESVTVVSERLAVNMMDTATRNKTAKQSYIPFLQSCILLESLPKFADSLAHGKTIADYMPLLEASLFRNMREPLHFLTLADGMTQYWGQPVEVSPCCTALHRENINGSTASRNRGELLVKSVSYNVVDCDTQCGFMINIHYYKGEDFPSVGIVSNQYMNAQGTGVLQTKLRAPKTFVSRKENYDEDNFLSAPLLVEEVGKASFASMAGLIATLK